MLEYQKKYPEYGFSRHKGYATKEHVRRLLKQTSVVGILLRQTGRFDKLRAAAGEVHHLVHQISVHFVDELFRIEVEVIEPRAKFRGVVISNRRRIRICCNN